MAKLHSDTGIGNRPILVIRSYQLDDEDYHEFTTTYFETPSEERGKLAAWIGEKVGSFQGIGVVCGVIAGLAAAALKILPVLLPYWNPVQVISYGFIMTMILSLVQALCAKSSLKGTKGERLVLTLRSACFAMGVLLLYLALRFISVGMLASIGSCQTILVVLFARFILKEPFYLFDAIAGLFMVIGVVLIANPTSVFGGDDVPQPSGIVLACGAIILLALNSTLSGKLQNTPNATVMFYASFAGNVTGIIFLLAINELMPIHAWHDVFIVIIVGSIDWAFMNLFLYAFKWSPAALVILAVVSVNTLASYGFQMAVHHQLPTLTTIIGAVLIFCCILAASVRSLAFPSMIMSVSEPNGMPVVSTPVDKSPLLPYRAVSVASDSGILRSPAFKSPRKSTYLQVPSSPGPLAML